MVCPPGSRAKKQVSIPVPSLIVRLMRNEPITDQVLWIPKVHDTGIDQATSIPLISRIESQFHGPDSIDAQFRVRIFL
jgi:hypothetical protein